LKIFASTNLRENIDSAFLRRMEIQLFLGNPSALARLEWIKKKSVEAEK
jgi:SpoVK/Ycf46/Vps4 family AAA+-type ATPase